MAVEEMLPKIKSDFFAILIPGSFVIGVIVSGVLVFTQYDTKTGIMDRFNPLFDTMKGNWIFSLIAFVMIFLVGNLLRALRVNNVDKISNFLFKRFIKNPFDKPLFETLFPYRETLKYIKAELLQVKLIEDITLPEDKNAWHDIYNYWKMAICIESPGSFYLIQDLEGRVRMFAGMFWAGAAGILGSVIIALGFFINGAAMSVWGGYILFMFILSAIIAVSFALNLKRVRRQEVISVFLAYLYLQKRAKDEDKKEKGKEKGSVLGPLLNMFKGTSSSS
jgi:hypothetical protein